MEGISYLLLLGIAMPLKYAFDFPIAVKYTGWIHGLLFVLYIAAVLKAAYVLKWKFSRVALFFIASVLPFATFVLDRSLKAEEQDLLKPVKVKVD